VALSTRAARTMKQSCGRASRIALTALLFTEHLDLTGWTVQSTRCGSTARPDRGDGVLNPPSLDVAGDLECVQRCWRRFPDGPHSHRVEFGQLHQTW
jgi:histidinol-phosphatase (PHP family)